MSSDIQIKFGEEFCVYFTNIDIKNSDHTIILATEKKEDKTINRYFIAKKSEVRYVPAPLTGILTADLTGKAELFTEKEVKKFTKRYQEIKGFSKTQLKPKKTFRQKWHEFWWGK